MRGAFSKGLSILVVVVGMAFGACGGEDPSADEAADVGGTETPQETQAPANEGASSEASEAPSGPIELNTIRVGSDTWTRTLDGSGQCFLPAEDGGNPVDGTVWGSAEPGGVNFSVSYGEVSGNPTEADVEGSDFWWVAKGDDLVIEFDYDAMTISGSGTFENQLLAEAPRQGDFLFQCEPDS